ncbi:MAG TPA: FAD-dependent oxidoreductase [Bacteroidia bacterium]|jgi:glycine/D-amino acid oxidase-like deaminating enzyme|nr:FAD-dependent oxidoreductase [Bacteroidia bacterium]
MHRVDHLIVGQGITGSMLALTLLRRGKTVAVIDDAKLSSSSKIAGGVYNPFNFKFMMNLWKAKEMVVCVNELCAYAEKISREKIHTQRKIFKILAEAERKQWEEACMMREGLFADEKILEVIPEGVVAPHGIGVVNGGGNVDCELLLHVVSEQIIASGHYLVEQFQHERLDLSNGEAVYDHKLSAKYITFCEGHLARRNPLFNFIPFKPAKGQLLHVHIPGLKCEEILSRGVSLIPLGNERFILSGTFGNDQDDERLTEEGKEELLEKVKKFISLPITVENQLAGVRPATQDRRSVVGIHPLHLQVSIINGTGSRAVLLTPFLSEKLCDAIYEGKEIPVEVNVRRFLK